MTPTLYNPCMVILRLISFASIVVAIFVANAAAQETAQSEFVIQVQRSEGCVVSSVSPKSKMGYVLYALPRPPKIPPDSAGNLITSKVFVRARQEGNQWHVEVTIGKGEFYDAGDVKVGDFKLSNNQFATVPEVAQHGLSPIRVGVLRINRQQAGKPSFRNLSQSIMLEATDVKDIPDPFKLTLKNNSAQNLVAVQYNTFGVNGFLGLKWLSPGLLEPLIKAGESYKLSVNSEDNSCGDEEGYYPNPANRIDLVSAVFADGSYEGEPGLAALIKGKAVGNRKNLERVVGTIGEINDPMQLSQQFKNLHDGMDEEVDGYLVDTLRAMLPALPNDAKDGLHSFIRAGMHEVRVNLERDAQMLQMIGERNNPDTSTRWVERLKTKYERWFIASQNMTSR